MEYKLSTEAVNSYGIKVLTQGIRVPSGNVPMLFGHDAKEVLGNWTNFRKENENLYATPIWDENDPKSLTIRSKVEQGFIDGISIGLSILKAAIPDDESLPIEITESVLLEASITPLPSNREARIKEVENSENKIPSLTFSLQLGDETNISVINETLRASVTHNTLGKQIKHSIEMKENEVKNIENVEVEDKPDADIVEIKEVEVKEKIKKVTKDPKVNKKLENKILENSLPIDREVDLDSLGELDENIEGFELELSEDALTLADRIIKMFDIKVKENENKYSKVILELGRKFSVNNKELLELSTKVIELNNVLDIKNKEILELNQRFKDVEIGNYLDNAIRIGKIDEVQREKYFNISKAGMFDEVKEIIDQATVTLSNTAKVSTLLTLSDNIEKDFEWYQKNDSKALIEMKRNDLERYEALLSEYIKKNKN